LGSFDDRELQLEVAALRTQLEETREQQRVAVEAADLKIESGKQALLQSQTQEQAQQLLVETQRGQIQLHQAQLESTQSALKRMQGLEPIVTQQTIEQQQMRILAARTALRAAETTLKRLMIQQGHGEKLAQSQVTVAEAAKAQVGKSFPIESLSKKLEVAIHRLSELTSRAPSRGQILKVHVHAGEFVGVNPVLQMADLTTMSCVAEVPEVFKHRIELDQKAIVTSRAFPKDFPEQGLKGRVEFISPMIARPSLRGLDPYAPADRHVFEVRIVFSPDDSERVAAFVDMQVDVEFPETSGSP
jgi:HlyD family secretion protein